mgnify:CR=1 FL=1
MTESKSTGKGRATPSRKQQEAANLRPLVGKKTPESRKAERAQIREERIKARIGMAAGEEKYLGVRDRGPQRKFVRNYVDARKSIGEYFLPIIFVVLFLTLIPSPIFQIGSIIIMYTVLLISVIDGIFLGRKLKKAVAEKFPDTSTKGIAMYGWLRSTQMRRMRTPKPSINRGDAF